MLGQGPLARPRQNMPYNINFISPCFTQEIDKTQTSIIPGPTPWQDGGRSNFLPSGGAQNLRRMTFCAPSANLGKRRPSFGGALRLKKFEKLSPVHPEKPDFLRLPDKPDFTAITPVKKLVQHFNQSVSY